MKNLKNKKSSKKSCLNKNYRKSFESLAHYFLSIYEQWVLGAVNYAKKCYKALNNKQKVLFDYWCADRHIDNIDFFAGIY